MGRDLVEIELADEERTRKAAFRRESLCQLLADLARAAISNTYMTVKSNGVWIREAHCTLPYVHCVEDLMAISVWEIC